MKFKTLTFLLLSFTNCFSQVDFRENYYPKIYEAEQAIVKDDLKKASESYEQAFSFVKKPLAKDIFNATVCKFLINDLNGARPLLFKLAQKGVSAQMLESKEIFTLPDVKKMWEGFKPTYESIQKETVEGYNHDYLTKTKAIRDSVNSSLKNAIFSYKMGKTYIDFSKIDFSKMKDSSYLKTLPVLDSIYVKFIENQNSNRIREAHKAGKELVKKEIEKGGIWPEEWSNFTDENFSKNEFQSDLSFYAGLSARIFKNGNHSLNTNYLEKPTLENLGNVQKYYIEAIKEGNLNPMVGFRINEFGSKFMGNLISMFAIHVEDTTGCPKKWSKYGEIKYVKRGIYSKEQLDEFEMLRKEYGMDNIENLIAKEIFASTKNQYFIFLSNKSIEESTVPNCSVAEHELLGAEILEE